MLPGFNLGKGMNKTAVEGSCDFRMLGQIPHCPGCTASWVTNDEDWFISECHLIIQPTLIKRFNLILWKEVKN